MYKTKILIMDVDGTLTDGKIYMSGSGELFKAFDIKDGYGINEILPQFGIVPVIITGRTSKIVENRAHELGITELYQGKHEKLETMLQVMEKFKCVPEEVAYMGDDILDIPCMEHCGLVGCPSNAVDEVKAIATFVASKEGGQGAVREFIEWLTGNKRFGS